MFNKAVAIIIINSSGPRLTPLFNKAVTIIIINPSGPRLTPVFNIAVTIIIINPSGPRFQFLLSKNKMLKLILHGTFAVD